MNFPPERYRSLSRYLKETYGEPLYKLSLNGGMTCPNRDGTLGTCGCIFCSEGGSGDFAASPRLSVAQQLAEAKERIAKKYPSGRYIAYFQAYTNTYAPVPYLRRIFTEAISDPSVAVLSIATRPDCLPDDVLDLLSELNKIKPVWVELGLQTMHERTALLINRGYPLSCFTEAVTKLTARGIVCIAHMILGLPDETQEDMVQTARYLSGLPISGVKLQLLHILKGTVLAEMYENRFTKDCSPHCAAPSGSCVFSPNGAPTAPPRHVFPLLTQDAYVTAVIACLEYLRPDIVIHRLTGDGPKDLLLAPLWSRNKRGVLNEISRQLKLQNTYQGKKYKESEDHYATGIAHVKQTDPVIHFK